MEALRDMSWMRQLYSSSPLERFEHGRFAAVALGARGGASRHDERYLYRILFFEPGSRQPAIAVNLETDILGACRLTVQSGSRARVAASFDMAPGYEAFKALALPLADAEAGPDDVPAGRGRSSRGKPARPASRARP